MLKVGILNVGGHYAGEGWQDRVDTLVSAMPKTVLILMLTRP
jgi:hypothetical protein